MVGAAWALTFTFALVAFAWRRPRFRSAQAGPPVADRGDHTGRCSRDTLDGRRGGAGFHGVGAAGRTVGSPDELNALLGVFYVLLWVGLVALSLLFGPVWRVISPMRTVYLLLRRCIPGRARLSYPDAWGYRPAAVGLFAFVWMELASPDSASLPWVKAWLLLYGVAMLAGAWLCGQRWLARADPFGVYSMAVSRLCPFRRNPATGKIVIGNPFDHLLSLPVRPGVVVLLAVLLGSTAFDSFSSSPTWRGFADRIASANLLPPTLSVVGAANHWADCLHFGCGDDLFARRPCDGRRHRDQRRTLPGEMAHSLSRSWWATSSRTTCRRRARPAGRLRARRSAGPRLESVAKTKLNQ